MANPFDILKQLQGLQSRVGELQEKLKSVHVVGSSGGGMITIEMNGQIATRPRRRAAKIRIIINNLIDSD